MLLLADENFPRLTVDALRRDGQDVIWVRTAAPGTKDSALLDQAETEGRLLLTFDKDIWQIALQRREPISNCGVMLFRLHPAVAAKLTPLVRRALDAVGDGWRGHVSIVTVDRIQMIRARDRG